MIGIGTPDYLKNEFAKGLVQLVNYNIDVAKKVTEFNKTATVEMLKSTKTAFEKLNEHLDEQIRKIDS